MLVPDDLVLQLLQNRLAQLDAVTKGWVIHGFPKTREQAESLTKVGYEPNRCGHLSSHTVLCFLFPGMVLFFVPCRLQRNEYQEVHFLSVLC